MAKPILVARKLTAISSNEAGPPPQWRRYMAVVDWAQPERLAMYDFDHLLNWKLLRGSHAFPGPHGGTCIVEAAVVAAGYPYRQIGTWGGQARDCPDSFSVALATYALCLNDAITDDALRQTLLLPFVTRFDGSADTAAVEAQRVAAMGRRTIQEVLAPAMAEAGFGVWARTLLRIGHDPAQLGKWIRTRSRSGRPLPPE